MPLFGRTSGPWAPNLYGPPSLIWALSFKKKKKRNTKTLEDTERMWMDSTLRQANTDAVMQRGKEYQSWTQMCSADTIWLLPLHHNL